MTDILDIMLLESIPHAGDDAAAALTEAGHRVHRCHEQGGRGFPCTGITRPVACPIARGADVALLVRPRLAPRPTPLEDGATCAIRAGVPLVEDGPGILDPFEPWLAARNAGDVVKACTDAAQQALEPLRRDIVSRVAPLLHAAGIDIRSVQCQVERDRPRIRVRLDGPAIRRPLRQALAVRVLDSVRAAGRVHGEVDVSYHTAQEATNAR